MHTLKIDGRKYIGLTKYSNYPNKRWCNGKGYKEQSYFWNAIQKYGWDNFKHEIVFESLTKEQACNKEKALIKLFNTTDDKFGFNLTAGGDGTTELPLEIRNQINLKNTKYMISEQELKHYYLDLKKSMRECANYFGCSVCVIQNNLIKFGIETRHHEKLAITKDDLINLLVNEHKTQQEAANILGCSKASIEKYQRKFNIKIKKICTFNIDEVKYQYITLNKPRAEVANYFNCSEGPLKKFLAANNIKKLKS